MVVHDAGHKEQEGSIQCFILQLGYDVRQQLIVQFNIVSVEDFKCPQCKEIVFRWQYAVCNAFHLYIRPPIYTAIISCIIEGKLVSMFDEPHFEWHNTVNVDFSCEEAEVVGGRGFPHSLAGSRFRGRLCQVASPSVSTPFPGKQEDKSQGELVMPAHIWWPRLIQMAASSCKGLVEWGNGVPGRCFQQQLCVLEGSMFLGCCAKELTVRTMTMFPSSKGICNAHLPNQTGREKSVQPSSYFPKM